MNNIIISALELGATSKTTKYFMNNSDAYNFKDASMSGRDACTLLTETMNAVASAKNNGKIFAHNNNYYDATEYKFPTKFSTIINAHYVSLTTNAIKMHKYVDDTKFNVNIEKVMTPTEVNRFFELYNAAQNDTTKVETAAFQYVDVVLTDVPQVTDGKNWYATNEEFLTNYSGYAVELKVDDKIVKYLTPIPSVDKTEVARWMLE